MKRMLAVSVAIFGLVGCGGNENGNEQVVELPNRQACEIVAEGPNLEKGDERDANFERAFEVAEGDLVAPMAFIRDFDDKNPGFFDEFDDDKEASTTSDDLESIGQDLAELNAMGPVIEAFNNITAICARAGVALQN